MAGDENVTWSDGQRSLINAIRLHENKNIGQVINQSSVDDLEWFLQTIEYQLEETPRHVHDPKQLERIQGWHRRVRTAVTTALGQKRPIARAQKIRREWGEKLIIGLVIAVIILVIKELILA